MTLYKLSWIYKTYNCLVDEYVAVSVVKT